MPPKKTSGGQNDTDKFTFLVTTDLSSSAADKRKVRSAAAVSSWPERRKRTFEQFESTSKHAQVVRTSPQDAEQSGGAQGVQYARHEPLPVNLATESLQETKQKPAGSRTDCSAGVIDQEPLLQQPRPIQPRSWQLITPTFEADDSIILPASRSCTREATPDLPCRCVQCSPELHLAVKRKVRPILMPSTRRRTTEGNSTRHNDPITPPPSPPPTTMADPFNCYPVPYKRWFDDLLHHMLTVYAPRGWPALKITRTQGLKWEWFMTQHALSDPALFYVRLLFASGDLIRLRVLQPEVSYWLRAQAIRAINEALEDPRRACSDALILAVGRIALNESMYGDRHAAHTIHRPAQQRMIQMRGGMRALEFPELVKRLMRWSDTVMSKQGGTQRFIEDEEEIKNFGMDESVNVLEKWVPQQGQELRKKSGSRIWSMIEDYLLLCMAACLKTP